MRVLVVEDKESVASFIKRGLQEECYAVDVVGDGPAAERIAMEEQYDAIVLDLMLPSRDGLDVCRNLRARGVASPILILSARDHLNDKVAGLDAGADDYLTKPFAFEELLARLRALLRRGKSAPPGPLRVADLVLDPARHKLTRSGRTIELTVKEYQLLECLLRRAGEVVTRTKLSEHVWCCSEDTFTNVIDVYIARLRRKIDRGFSPALIKTVRGVGYMLSEEP